MTATATKERPINFTQAELPMVRAILEGRKTQFRRVVKPQPEFVQNGYEGDGYRTGAPSVPCYAWPPTAPFWRPMSEHAKSCPFGAPGDRLYVREAFSRNHSMHYSHKSSKNICGILYQASWDGETDYYDRPFEGLTAWLDAREMPRELSRITLEVKRVWVERVQEISEEDARDEGCKPSSDFDAAIRRGELPAFGATDGFRELWDSINAAKGYGWDANPWVWCVEFERVER